VLDLNCTLTRRPIDQVKLDPVRKPAQLLAFAELKTGDRVADFMSGNAYFTRIMSDVVDSTAQCAVKPIKWCTDSESPNNQSLWPGTIPA